MKPPQTAPRAGAVLLALTLVGAPACGPDRWRISTMLPRSIQSRAQPDPGREIPAARAASFERAFRSGDEREPRAPYDHGYRPTEYSLVYPMTSRREAAWRYVLLARDYAALHDLGGAARSYWAAISMTRSTFSSRGDRERTRIEAYRGLVAIARERHQHEWATSLSLIVDLIETYLAAPQCEVDEREFFGRIDRIRGALEQAERARDVADAASRFRVFAAVMSVIGGAVNAVSNQGEVSANVERNLRTTLSTILEAEQAQSRAMHEIQGALGASRGQISLLRGSVANDVAELDEGLSVLATEVAGMLHTARDVSPYVVPLRRFAANRAVLLEAINAYAAHPTPANLIALGTRLQEYERTIFQYERNGLRAPGSL